MLILNKKEPIMLFIGDILFLTLSLWLTLTIRHSQIPSYQVFLNHLGPFAILFFIWIVVFFIAGFYERKALINHRNFFSEIF